ncbi:MAG: methylated-DNA--[protein]-cysteine S-methyltransferase [Bacteroidetes bacterium]|nr:methylated-DNA--[protein]-cysteine S-methyltransferase [Bacteroidota bacterium]MBT5528145.1 methylated-DNA--[protein]-cysteine S-methyltransferase [Cytophagia bacterium]MBT3802829.1 methylated-DNA--[protein]-cysteine S-methyltransferase [Bacteroidota bacterium]MBT3935509.1 methylated-DNA--[protein]-cysteine S-methyltransferase [Bacteroidota bacterium]MBT4339683.1 methylated-DNA--[protein]-cysteine S-methyltransferase [Bacteroidota bacterium]
MEQLFKAYYKSPIGFIELIASNKGLRSLYFSSKKGENDTHEFLAESQKQLHEYFTAMRKEFDLPFDLIGTEFQLKVWNTLLNIPFGKTASYLDLANLVATAKHTRAVGLANGANPISIILPCHRVIGKNGKLVGYGGGLERKQWLLDFESESRQLSMF